MGIVESGRGVYQPIKKGKAMKREKVKFGLWSAKTDETLATIAAGAFLGFILGLLFLTY
jgi:hypothetical protein